MYLFNSSNRTSIKEDLKEAKHMYPCDNPDSYCPFNAIGGHDCRNYCGLGVDEDEEENE